MSWADLLILAVIGVSIVLSLVRGLVRELVSLVAWVASFWLAIRYYPMLAGELAGLLSEPWMRAAAAFLILLLGGLIVGGVVGFVVGRLVAGGGLSGTDRLLGGAFGLVRGVAIVALAALMLGATPLSDSQLWRASVLLPRLDALARTAVSDYERLSARDTGSTPAPVSVPNQAGR